MASTVAAANPTHPDTAPRNRARHRRPTTDDTRPLRGQSYRPNVYVPDEPGMYAGIPGWRSRDRYLGALTRWLLSAAADALCRTCKLQDRAKILAVAAALADYADHDTGRRCAPAYDTIAAAAGVARITVRRAEDVLRAGGWMRVVWSAGYLTTAQRAEARALTGHKQVRSGNVRALTIPADQAIADRADSPSSTGHEHQPATKAGKSVGFSPKNSPTRAHARRSAPRTAKPAPTRPSRPIRLQLLAARMAQHLPQLIRDRHIGAAIDALSWAGIDPDRWGPNPARAAVHLAAELNRVMAINRLRSPLGWLHSALQRIDPDQPTPWETEQRTTAQRHADRAAAADQAETDRAAAIPLAESTAAAQIRDELRRIAAKPRPSKPLPPVPGGRRR